MRLLLFTGKGGVGKTTAACATALRCADRGRKTLLVSGDPAHSVADALGRPLTDGPLEVADGLWAAQLDTQHRLESAWREVEEYLLRLLDQSGVDAVLAEELAVLPGIDEVLTLLAVRDLAAQGTWDTIVLDCAPTAETLRLLALPEALGWYLDRILPAQRRLAQGLRPLAGLLGRGDAIPPDGLFAAVLRLADEMASVRALLSADSTSVRLVLTPEAVVVAEARRTLTALALYGYRVDALIANRVFPTGDDEWRSGWVTAQQRQLALMRSAAGSTPVGELEYLATEPIGPDALRAVAAKLYGELPGDDPAAPAPVTESLRVERDGAQFVLRLDLPLSGDETVDVVRAGDTLVVTVDALRRVVALPSVLRRCEVVSGVREDTGVSVRFVPDPGLWPEQIFRADREAAR
ncbi:MAG: ArsA family ATPase [Actinobacteria bacterium]|nr:ArsA family ATPase [Actinomycetota bacterium]